MMMEMMSHKPLPPATFYGVRSRKRSLNVKHCLEKRSKRLRDEKIPDTYHSRILGPSACWQIFYRQQDALDFVSSNTEDLHVFAFECRQPDKQSGQRQFLTATYPVLWHYYVQLDENQRHHYEVIPEAVVPPLATLVCHLYLFIEIPNYQDAFPGCPCKLYFDLEFHRPSNPGADGVAMVDILVKYVCCWLKELYAVQCRRHDVLELTASTDTKFSRHLIFQLEETVFQDNITAGYFVRAIFTKLEDHMLDSDFCNPQGKQGGNQQSVGYETVRDDTSDNSAFRLPQASEFRRDSEIHRSSLAAQVVDDIVEEGKPPDDFVNGEDYISRSENRSAAESVWSVTYQTNKSEEITGLRSLHLERIHNCEINDDGLCGVTECSTHRHCSSSELESLGDSEALCNRESSVPDPGHCDGGTSVCAGNVYVKQKLPHQTEQTDCNQIETDLPVGERLSAREKTKYEMSVEMEESIPREGETVESTREGGRTEADMNKICRKVFQQFELNELRSMFVKDKDGRDTCFADLGVYTKNRNFRLYKSRKLGKTTAFTVAEQNTCSPADASDDRNKEREIFLASLITNVRNTGTFLAFGDRIKGSKTPCKDRKSGVAQAHTSPEHIEGCGKSPYPEVDDFITHKVADEGRGGCIRCWTYFPTAEVLSYDIVGYRFCYNVQRHHRSNNIKLIADLRRGVWYQKCYDPDCQSVNFKSQEFQLPDRILPANYFADEFEDLDDDSGDDEACVLALQEAEQRMTTEMNSFSDFADSSR